MSILSIIMEVYFKFSLSLGIQRVAEKRFGINSVINGCAYTEFVFTVPLSKEN